jgi:hypothetical protein
MCDAFHDAKADRGECTDEPERARPQLETGDKIIGNTSLLKALAA